MGIANPIPSAHPAIAVLIPMTCPLRFTRGHPEFPRLIAASVWRRLWIGFERLPNPPLAMISRHLADKIPVVTVF